MRKFNDPHCKTCGAKCCRYPWVVKLDYADKQIIPEELHHSSKCVLWAAAMGTHPGEPTCIALDKDSNRCSIYAIRPDVCKKPPVGGVDCNKARFLFRLPLIGVRELTEDLTNKKDKYFMVYWSEFFNNFDTNIEVNEDKELLSLLGHIRYSTCPEAMPFFKEFIEEVLKDKNEVRPFTSILKGFMRAKKVSERHLLHWKENW